MNAPKLNKKQKQYLSKYLWVRSSIKSYKQIKDNYALQLALMMLDGRGWLIDDYTEAVRQFIYDHRKGLEK
jgi:hypothetical protein